MKIFFFLLAAAIAFSGCRKKEEKSTPPAAPATYYFHAVIGGGSVSFEVTAASGYGAGSANGTGTVDSGWLGNQGSYLVRPFLPANSAGYSLLKFFIDEPTGTEFESMFHTGSYPFGKEEDISGNYADGVVIAYVDAAGKRWASDSDPGAQTGSSFTITSHSSNGLGDGYSVTKAVFNCTLYDTLGNAKTLTGGEMVGRSLLY